MAERRDELIQRLAELGVSQQGWIGIEEMSADALELLLESVEQHRELWQDEGPEPGHDHQHDHAPGEPHEHTHTPAPD